MPEYQRIMLSSAAADRFLIDEGRTDFLSFDLNEPIICKAQQRIHLSLETFSFPNTAYNLRPENNVLTFLNGSTAVNVTVPVGQYTTPEAFVTALQTAIGGLTTVTVLYNPLTNKLSFQNTSASVIVTVKANSKMRYIVGLFQTIDLVIPVSSTVVAPRQLDISNGRTVNFAIRNLDFDTLDSNGGRTLSSILGTVPIASAFGQIQTFINPVNSMIKVNTKNITYLDVKLVNLNNEPFDMGGLKWSAVILVTIE